MRDPRVAATMVPGMFISVETVRAPPKSSTASEGMGGNTFSMKMRKKIPK